MFPIGDDDVRGAGPAILTWVLVGINVLVFIYELTLGQEQLKQFLTTFGVVPAQVTQGRGLVSLITSMFIHGGWAHIFSNMVFLLVFGDNVEAVLGKLGHLGLYLCGGLAATVAQILADPGSTIPSLGASGAVAALLGTYVVMFPQSRIRALVTLGFYVFVTRVTAVIFLGVWFLTQFLNGVANLGVETAQTSGVAYWAHIGGFVFGLIVGFLFRGRAEEKQIARA